MTRNLFFQYKTFLKHSFYIITLLFIFTPIFVFADTSSLQLSVLKPPIPVASLDKQYLIYELQFVNQEDQPVRIGRIEIFDEYNDKLAVFTGNRLIRNSLIYKDNKPIDSKQPIELSKGMGVFIFIWIPIDSLSNAPEKLSHKIWIVKPTADKSAAPTSLINYDVLVSDEKPIVLSAPLKGYGWVASGGPAIDSYHRKALLYLDGKFYLSQRFAVDWMQICPDGTAAQGNLRDNNNWPAFGHEVMAVADGEITLAHHGIPENTPPEFPNALKVADMAGNYVIEKIHQNGKEYYILYAHMQPGSLRVKIGDKVKEGQVIGLLGNTGNSSAPHLHLHVADANDPLKAEGVPFIFKSSTIEGRAQQIDADFAIWKPFSGVKTKVKHEMPLFDQVFHFSDDVTHCKPNL